MTGLEITRLHEILDAAGASGDTLSARVEDLVARHARLEERLAERARVTDYDRLLADLDTDRTLTLRLLADVCLDAGREAEAKGWGWLGMAGKWPVYSSQRGWYWHGIGGPSRVGHRLPIPLFELLAPNHFETPRAALQAVVTVIAQGKWTEGSPATPKGAP